MNRCGCIEEDSQQSPTSPGIVEPHESIVFACIHPETAPERGVSMFPMEKLKKFDLSVCRGDYSEHSDLLSHVVRPQLAKYPAREYKGYYWTTCEEIRDVVAPVASGQAHSDNRTVGAYCVVDDALGDYTAHAVIGFSRPENNFWKKHDRQAARGNLLIAVQRRGLHRPADRRGEDCPGFARQSQPDTNTTPHLKARFEAVWSAVRSVAEKVTQMIAEWVTGFRRNRR
jgi:hypothetical protein